MKWSVVGAVNYPHSPWPYPMLDYLDVKTPLPNLHNAFTISGNKGVLRA